MHWASKVTGNFIKQNLTSQIEGSFIHWNRLDFAVVTNNSKISVFWHNTQIFDSGYMNRADQQGGSSHQSNSVGSSSQKFHLNTQSGREDGISYIRSWSLYLRRHTSAQISLAKASAWPWLISKSVEKYNLTFV